MSLFPCPPSFNKACDQTLHNEGFAWIHTIVFGYYRWFDQEVNPPDSLPIESSAIYKMDHGYTDFGRLYRFTLRGAFFVIRAKSNLRFYVVESRPLDGMTVLRCNQSVRLTGANAERTIRSRCIACDFTTQKKKDPWKSLTTTILFRLW